jgi:hypothetical protein
MKKLKSKSVLRIQSRIILVEPELQSYAALTPSTQHEKIVDCTVGWVDLGEKIILNKSTPGIYSFLCTSSENRRKIFLSSKSTPMPISANKQFFPLLR